jgi:hypothetical protein
MVISGAAATLNRTCPHRHPPVHGNSLIGLSSLIPAPRAQQVLTTEDAEKRRRGRAYAAFRAFLRFPRLNPIGAVAPKPPKRYF